MGCLSLGRAEHAAIRYHTYFLPSSMAHSCDVFASILLVFNTALSKCISTDTIQAALVIMQCT